MSQGDDLSWLYCDCDVSLKEISQTNSPSRSKDHSEGGTTDVGYYTHSESIDNNFMKEFEDNLKQNNFNWQGLPSLANNEEETPYRDDSNRNLVKKFEDHLKQYNLEEEGLAFLKCPATENVFNPNFEYYSQKGEELGFLKNFEDSVRNELRVEIDSNSRLEMFRDEQGCEQDTNQPRTASPDLFGDSSDEETEKNANGAQRVSEPIVDVKSNRSAELLKSLEKLIVKFLESLTTNGTIEIAIDDTSKWENCELIDGVLSLKSSETLKRRKISLSHVNSKQRFTLIMYILSKVYHMLVTGTTCTVRELYYQDPELAENQVNIANAIRDVCLILNALPWELGIYSSSKGLIAGQVRITLANDDVIDCSLHSGATLLPMDTTGIKCIESSAKFVLLVEKDTVFEKLVSKNILEKFGQDIILVTGKGFPDINTRVIINKIWNECRIPIYALVDADPFGIEIMFVYRYGSKRMMHNADILACPEIRWIGIHPSEITSLAIPSMPLNDEDKKKLRELLGRTYLPDAIRDELVVMERTNRKAEIEGVSSFSLNFLVSDYIPNKIKRNYTI